MIAAYGANSAVRALAGFNVQEKSYAQQGIVATVSTELSQQIQLGGVAVGTLAAIIKDEAQATAYYPRMSRGWTYQYSISHNFTWQPHPYYPSKLE